MGGGNNGPLGTDTNSPTIDKGTLVANASPTPAPVGCQHTHPAKARPPATDYNPGVAHDHKPTGRWDEIQSHANTSMFSCKHLSFEHLANAAINNELINKPNALKHALYYMAGVGVDYNEDATIKDWLQSDKGIQFRLWKEIPRSQTKGSYRGHFEFLQNEYDEEDFQYSFGGIDRVDYEVDFDHKTIHVWFQDRYEWHPYYPGIYAVFDGDLPATGVRETNCVHAAFVEMKSIGAKDFWMKGEATVPLSVITPASPSTSSKGTI